MGPGTDQLMYLPKIFSPLPAQRSSYSCNQVGSLLVLDVLSDYGLLSRKQFHFKSLHNVCMYILHSSNNSGDISMNAYLHQITMTRMQTAANTSTITDTATPATMTMLVDELSVWPGSVDTPVYSPGAVDTPGSVDTPGAVGTPESSVQCCS